MRRLIVLILASCLGACASRHSRLLLPSDTGSSLRLVDVLLASHPLPPSQNILSVPLARTEALSNHLVQIQDRESPHVHAKHDLVVTLLRGNGVLHLGGEAAPMQSGDMAVVVRGEQHFFVNRGAEPAVAFVTFAPPYEGNDNIPVD